MRILIVDDEDAYRSLLKDRLELDGHEVVTASNITKALDVIVTAGVRLVVSDWNMPEGSGIELVQRVRRDRTLKYVYFILLTAHNTKEDLANGLDAGADDFVSKPFDWKELGARIRAGQRIIALMDQVSQLSGLLPICASCKQIKNDAGYWQQIEVYIRDRSPVEFSHGLCPGCYHKLYPEFARGS